MPFLSADDQSLQIIQLSKLSKAFLGRFWEAGRTPLPNFSGSTPSLGDPTSAIADHIKATGHNIKWDHFDILASGKTDYHYHCNIKETLLIQELKPALCKRQQ